MYVRNRWHKNDEVDLKKPNNNKKQTKKTTGEMKLHE